MTVYFIAFAIEPETSNSDYSGIEEGLAYCWIKATDSVTSRRVAEYKVRQYGWRILDVLIDAQAVILCDYQDGSEGAIACRKAINTGMAIDFLGIARSKQVRLGPQRLTLPSDIDLNDQLTSSKSRKCSGYCLFPTGDKSACGAAIGSHSIQKMGALSRIADQGKVVVPSADIGALRETGGMVKFRPRGIGKTSVFHGFCSKHDNDLFSPIDDAPLRPDSRQALLYAYRVICMELVAKRNLLAGMHRLECAAISSATRLLMRECAKVTELALASLVAEKERFDESILTCSWSDVRYVAFVSKDAPTIAFSGLLCPWFGFGGEIIANNNLFSSFLSASFAPMGSKWAVLFAWHKNSHDGSNHFLRSLAGAFNRGARIEDCVFRMLVKTCENFALSPRWWDTLTTKQQALVSEAASVGAGPFSAIRQDFLSSGLEGLVSWRIESVIDASFA